MYQLLSDLIKIFGAKSNSVLCALCPDSVGDPCQPESSEEEKPSILGVAAMTLFFNNITIGDPGSRLSQTKVQSPLPISGLVWFDTNFSRFGMNSLFIPIIIGLFAFRRKKKAHCEENEDQHYCMSG